MNDDWTFEAGKLEKQQIDASSGQPFEPPQTPGATVDEVIAAHAEAPANSNEDATEPFVPFDKRNISVDRITSFIFAAVVTIGAIIGLIVLLTTVGLNWVFYLVAGIAALVVLLLIGLAFAWPKIEHRHRAWRLTNFGLEIKHGVWWKHLQAVPWARVQHADVSQGPLQRIYGIGTLTVHSAGTSNSSVALTGLAHQQAIDLRDQVLKQRSSSDVV